MKKLYFKLSDNSDMSNVIMTLEDCMEAIKANMEGVSQEEDEYEFTMVATWLTEEELALLPEFNG